MLDNNIFEIPHFMKFIVEFHNQTMTHGRLIKKIQKNDEFTFEEKALIEESFLIKNVAEWEVFIKNIFAHCVAHNTSKLAEHLDVTLPIEITDDNAYAIINGLNFTSLSSASEIKGLAKKVIVNHVNPFKNIEPYILSQIDDIYIFRNYIAHKSKSSKKKLMKLYSDKYKLTTFVEPGIFLLQSPKAEKDAVCAKSEIFYGHFILIATHIWEHLDPKSYKEVFNDANTEEGYIKSVYKMNEMFDAITKQLIKS